MVEPAAEVDCPVNSGDGVRLVAVSTDEVESVYVIVVRSIAVCHLVVKIVPTDLCGWLRGLCSSRYIRDNCG